jgi:thiol-disulfide isomerase/thioredoxin
VVLVDFWASWCAPCKASFPVYGRLDSEFSQRGLVIVAVSVDEDASAFEAFVRRFEPAFLVELDRGQKLVREVQVPSMPTSYLIDRKGRVRFMHPGFHGRPTELALRAEIETLLSEKAP